MSVNFYGDTISVSQIITKCMDWKPLESGDVLKKLGRFGSLLNFLPIPLLSSL